MKLLYCQDCADITTPGESSLAPHRCRCKRHAVWWEDPLRGVVRVCDTQGHVALVRELDGAPAGEPRAWLLGIANSLLTFWSVATPTADQVQALIDDIPDSYLFRSTRSLILRFRPGQTGDSGWALPYGFGEPKCASST